MDAGSVVVLLVALILLVGGIVLGLSCARWRAGRSDAARWWVRRQPVEELRAQPPFEGVALVLLPAAAETLLVLGLVILVGPFLAPVAGASLYGLLALAVLQSVILVGAWWINAYRWVLPLWVYPAWLREERARDREVLQSRERGGGAGRR